MPIKLGVSLLASSSRIRVSMARAAPAESALTARSWEPSRFAALARCAIRRFRQGRCTSKVSRFAQRFAGCRSIPASISRRPIRRASAGPFRASALPIAISRVATTALTSCARACVRRVQSAQLLLRRLGRIDQTERPCAAKSRGWLSGWRLSLDEGFAVGEFACAEIKERAHAGGVAQIGVRQEPQFALNLGERGCQLRKHRQAMADETRQ